MHFKLCNLKVQKFIFNCYQTVTLTEISAGNFWNTTWCCRGNHYVVAKFEFYCFVLTKTSYVLPVTNIFLTHPFVSIDYWWDNFGGFLLSKLKKSKQFTHVSWRHSEETFKKFIAVGLILYRYGGWRIAPPPPALLVEKEARCDFGKTKLLTHWSYTDFTLSKCFSSHSFYNKASELLAQVELRTFWFTRHAGAARL